MKSALKDSQGKILSLAFRKKVFTDFKRFSFRSNEEHTGYFATGVTALSLTHALCLEGRAIAAMSEEELEEALAPHLAEKVSDGERERGREGEREKGREGEREGGRE